MKEANSIDDDGQPWPDPLSINYNHGTLSKIPTEYKITTRDLQRFWTFMWEQYGMNEMDDLFLNINGIDYVMNLRPGDIIYKIVPEDLEGFITNKKLNIDE